MANSLYSQWFYQINSSSNPYQAFVEFMEREKDNPELQGFLTSVKHNFAGWFDKMWNYYILNAVADGSMGSNDAYSEFSQQGVSPNEETSKYIDNLIAQQNTQADRDFQTEMRDTSLISSAGQLQSLGLSPSNVIQVGGASSGVTSQAADVSRTPSSINRKQQLAMNQYNQRMGIAKSLIGMAGSMASSGIYGHALGAAKHSASMLASAASHSGLQVLKNFSGKGNQTFALSPDGLFTGQ